MHLWQKSVVLNRETLESREKKKTGRPQPSFKKMSIHVFTFGWVKPFFLRTVLL